MRKTAAILGLFFFWLVIPIVHKLSSGLPKSVDSEIQIFFLAPHLLDFSDLDMRDSENRPIHSPRDRIKFNALVQNKLYQLGTRYLTPRVREMEFLLLRLASCGQLWLGKAVRWMWEQAADNLRRLQPNKLIDNLFSHVNAMQPRVNLFSSRFEIFGQDLLLKVISSTRILR